MTTIDINKRELLRLHAMVSDRATELRKHLDDPPGSLSTETAQEIEEMENLARKLAAKAP